MVLARMLRRRWKTLVRRYGRSALSLFLAGSFLIPGCAGPDREPFYLGDPELGYYEDVATRIEHPVVTQPTPDVVAGSAQPRTLSDNNHDEVWEMPLAEAIHLALKNNRIVRTRGEFLSPGTQLYNNPDAVTSVYDPAIRESGVLFGGRGVESALAAFDTQLTTRMIWNENKQVQNSLFALNGLGPGTVLDQDGAQFTTSLSKQFAYGATAQFAHNWNYDANNLPGRLFQSAYTGNVQFQYRQPLLAGAGTEYTRTAGPVGDNVQGLFGVNQGVVIARINTDITLVDFEASVRNMVKDVEDLYWDLYLAYRVFDSEVIARNSALRTWLETKSKFDIGAQGGKAADEAQAREAYFDARSRVEDALGGARSRNGTEGLYALELRLRRICGLPVNDGRVIRPSDEPVTAEFFPDWHMALAEGLTRREELRRQKWNIKSFELQHAAACNLANPRLDFVSSYQINGFGDSLINDDGAAGENGAEFNSAYRSLARYNQTGYSAGFEFSMPLGLRNANAQVRNLELRLTKAREVLAQQEHEVSHELANTFQTISWRYVTAQTNFNRRRAAERQLRAIEAEVEAGAEGATLDLLLRAQSRLAQTEIAYFQSITEYNKALAELHYRKGTLLEHNNIHLAEGTWSPEAYRDALRSAWARSAAFDAAAIDPLMTEPEPFVSSQPVGAPQLYEPGPIGAPLTPATPSPTPAAVPPNGMMRDIPPPPEDTPEEAPLPPSNDDPTAGNRSLPPSIGPTADNIDINPGFDDLPPIQTIPQPLEPRP